MTIRRLVRLPARPVRFAGLVPLVSASSPALVLAVACCLTAAALPPRHGPRFPRHAVTPVVSPGAGTQPEGQRVAALYGRLPLTFEPNVGQADPAARFLARGPGYTVLLTATDATLALQSANAREHGAVSSHRLPAVHARPKGQSAPHPPPAVVQMHLVGANPRAASGSSDEQPGKVNYFMGNDPKKWRANVPTYGRVRYRSIYPGVDVAYYGNQRQLEHDFIVQPGADPAAIRVRYSGAQGVSLDENGDLVLKVPGGAVRQRRPLIYQESDGRRTQIAGGYVLRGEGTRRAEGAQVAFAVGPYDRKRALVIDPSLVYSTYLGGSSDDVALGIAVDGNGNAYVAGNTFSWDFPTANPFQGTKHSPPVSPIPGYNTGGLVVFVTKFNASGSALIYSTYLGGSSYNDTASAVAVDSNGNVCVAGSTASTDFPIANAFQANHASDGGSWDAFVTKLDASGSALIYSTYLGGNSDDQANGIAVDSSGSVYVAGRTISNDFPTADPIPLSDGGGAAAFVTKLNGNGSALVYSTFLGGSSDDDAYAIAVDGSGNAYVVGSTSSNDFPTTRPFQANLRGSQDAFVTKLFDLSPPTNLVATGGNAQVTLSWKGSTGATSYNVYRSTVHGGPYVAQVRLISSPWVDRNVTNGTRYYYVVTANGPGGESGPSNEAFATPNAPPPPPTNLKATVGDQQVALAWSASAGATSYIVRRAAVSGGPYTAIATNVTTTSYIDRGLTNGKPYYYVVAAVNANGTGPNSAQVSAAPMPAAPTSLTATAGLGQVTLAWKQSVSAGITWNGIYRSQQNGGPYARLAMPLAATSYVDGQVTRGVTYYYRVTAVTSNGAQSNYSNQASATP